MRAATTGASWGGRGVRGAESPAMAAERGDAGLECKVHVEQGTRVGAERHLHAVPERRLSLIEGGRMPRGEVRDHAAGGGLVRTTPDLRVAPAPQRSARQGSPQVAPARAVARQARTVPGLRIVAPSTRTYTRGAARQYRPARLPWQHGVHGLPAEGAKRSQRRSQVRRARVRLTRRGRMTVRLLVAALVVLAMLAAAAATQAAPGPAGERGSQRSVVVRSGDTLWNIAERYLPHRDVGPAMREIRRLNNLHGSRIEVGQQLVLPSL